MKKAIIHIGGHKTGSTAIQKALFDSSLALSKQDICYPLELTCQEVSFFGQHSLAWYLLKRKDNNFGLPQHQIDDALNILSRLKAQGSNILLSSEDFAWLDDNAVCCLKNELNEYDIDVIIYVRRQDVAALALYQTDVLYGGQTKFFDQWFKERSSVFDYFSIIERWSKITDNKIIVRPYNREKFSNGDIVSDFEVIINNIFNRKLELIRTCKDLNKSIPLSITSIIRYCNTLPTQKVIVPKLIRLGNELSSSKKSNNYFQLISPSTSRAILEKFYEGNLELSKEYLGLNEVWFDDVITENDTEWKKNNSFNGSDLVALVNETLDVITSLKTNDKL